MAQGKKYNDDIKEKAFALLACNNNAMDVAKQLGLKYTTVKTWEKKYLEQSKELAEKRARGGDSYEVTKSESEFDLEKLRNENKKKFVNDAWRLIDKTKTLLERRLDRAIESEDELDRLVEEICRLDNKDLTYEQRKALYSKIKSLKLEQAKELAVVLGTLYDKQALANKEATAIVEGNITVKKFEDF